MVKIVLETGVLDVSDKVVFPITFNIGDIRDVSARKGTFSKTITLEGTKNNNELLGNYYDVNIQAGTFNINTLTKCQVIQNGIPILDEALLQLVSVNKAQYSSSYEEDITYTVLIKDSRSEFFSAITNKNLTDLDFSDLNHAFDSSAIVASFDNTVVDGYKYLMPYNETNVYQSNDFKPAIYAKTYFDRIFASAGFTYTWDALLDANFDKLLIPYNGDVNDQDYSDYLVKATNTWITSYVQPTGINQTFQEDITSGWTEVVDAQGLYDPITGQYTSPFNTSAIAGEYYTHEIAIGGTLSLDNISGSNAILDYVVAGYNVVNRYRIFAQVFIAGWGSLRVYCDPVIINYPSTSPLPNGSTTISNFATTLSVPIQSNGVAPSIDAGDIQILSIGVDVLGLHNGVPGQNFWYDNASNLVDVNVVLNLTSITLNILPSNNIQVLGSNLIMNQYVPVEIKQSDFVKSIFQMYNLYVEQDIDNPNNLILIHRDEYYDSGAEKDWSAKLAKDKEQELIFLPDLTNKKLRLTYATDEDGPNVAYTQATGQIYGQVQYTFENEYVKDIDIKELLFSPTPIYRTIFGAYTPALNGSAPNVNIRILYDGGQGTCQPFDIIDFGTTGQFSVTDYPVLGHFNNPLYPTFDINFGTNDYYFYQVGALTANNLYNLYWRRTVNQINVGKMLIAYFDLREPDIQSLKLNDKIYIDNSWWNINKIQDYNANNNSLTKVELISIDTEIDLAPFKIRSGKPIGTGIEAVGLDTILKSKNEFANVILPGADVIVKGRGNVVSSGTKGIIIGDNQTLSEDGIVTKNLTVTESINGSAVVPYKKYIALISQIGTNDPTAIVLENSLGDLLFTRISAGFYEITSSSLFTLDLTYMILANVNGGVGSIYYNTSSSLYFDTRDLTSAGNPPTDNLLINTTLEIRVYE